MSVGTEARELHRVLASGVSTERAFLALYRFLANSPSGSFGWMGTEGLPVDGVACDRQIVAWAAELRRSLDDEVPIAEPTRICEIGALLEEVARSNQISPNQSQGLVIALRVLDAAFRGVHVAEVGLTSDSVGLMRLRSNLRLGKPLFKRGSLQVFPKPRRTHVPDRRGQPGISQLLDVLTVVDVPQQIKASYQLILDGVPPASRGFERIGILPTIQHFNELHWTCEGDARYSIAESAAAEAQVHPRVSSALKLLLDANAEVVLMPELVSGPRMHDLVTGVLKSRMRVGESTPVLLVAGTAMLNDSEGKPRNRARVLDAYGDVAWEQDKMHAYRFTGTDQDKAGNPLGADAVDRHELIAVEPRTLVVVDLSGHQRVVLLTCEDFNQDEPHRNVIASFEATTILVPIMAGKRDSEDVGWVNEAAMRYVRHPGAASIVANSGTLLQTDAEREQWWQFGHIRASPQVSSAWEALRERPGGPVLAWIARMSRVI